MTHPTTSLWAFKGLDMGPYDRPVHTFEPVVSTSTPKNREVSLELNNSSWFHIQGLKDSPVPLPLLEVDDLFMLHFRPSEIDRVDGMIQDSILGLKAMVVETGCSDTYCRFKLEIRPEWQMNDPMLASLPSRQLAGMLYFPPVDKYIHMFRLRQIVRIDIVPTYTTLQQR